MDSELIEDVAMFCFVFFMFLVLVGANVTKISTPPTQPIVQTETIQSMDESITRYSNIRIGMSIPELTNILGEPSSIDIENYNGKNETHCYEYRLYGKVDGYKELITSEFYRFSKQNGETKLFAIYIIKLD